MPCCFSECWVLSPETCRVKPLRRINAIVASCWIYFTIIHTSIVPTLKNIDSSCLSNYRQISLLNNFSGVYAVLTHDHTSHYYIKKIMGLFYNPYRPCQRPWCATRSKTSFPCTRIKPNILTDAGLNTNYKIFHLYSSDSLLILYVTFVWPKPQYASTVWSSINSTDTKQKDRIPRKFAALCQNRFFTYDHDSYQNFLNL